MKSKKKTKIKIELTVVALIAIILMTQIIPHIKAEEEEDDSDLLEYLFLSDDDLTTLNHSFLAKGECYLYADIDNTDYIYVELDEEEYELSYGFNIIPVEFSENFEEHNILLPDSASTYIKSFAIEPLFIAEGNVTVPTSIGLGYGNLTFSAGGLISILLKPNFSYNELYVQLDEDVLKDIYVAEKYPEIDSQLYSYFAGGGSYLRFDINVRPEPHRLTINGNGSVEYIVMINDDWDEDDIPDVLEVQKQDLNGFHDLDPTNPNIWGFFQKSEAQVLINTNETNDPLEGYFNYHINKPGTYFLKIEVEEGEFFDIEFDGDSTTLKNTPLNGSASNNIAVVNITDWGWCYVSYKFLASYNLIKFFIRKGIDGPYKEILVLNTPQLIDSDGDGVKDFEEKNSNLKHQGSDSDGDGLPDNFDNSPYATLTLNNSKINRFVIPNNPQKNSIVSMQIKKPNNDYSTMGIPRLWRESLNVSITPALRLFGNRYQLYENYTIKELNQTAIDFLWGKSINTYNLVSGYNSEEIITGDPLPNVKNPDNETWFVFPNFADETWEFEFSFLRDNPAKNDDILDLRFDFIWFVTHYDSETNSTDILHYYNIEEDIVLQALTMREIGDIDYLLATPDNFVENQILWTLLQNPTIGSLKDFGVDDDLIGFGKVDYSNIAERLRSVIKAYYNNQTERNTEAEVSYFAGFQDSYDLLNKYILSLNNSLDSPLLNRSDFRSKYSYYSINNVYQDEDIQMGDPEVAGDQKTNYYISQNIFNESQQVATLSDLPIAMEVKNFPNSGSNILEITSAISEPIPLNEIPVPIPSTLMHPKIKLMNSTYIERHDSNEEIPKVNFDINTDIEKRYLENRAREFDRGELFFESDDASSSEAELFVSSIDSFFQIDLKNLHDLYNYFNTDDGRYNCSADIFNPFREFDDFLDNHIDENGQFQVEFFRKEPVLKLQFLGDFGNHLISMRALQAPEIQLEMVDTVIDIFSLFLDMKLDEITKNIDFTYSGIRFLRARVNVGKTFGCYTFRGRLGNLRGKLAYHWDRLKTNLILRGAIQGVQLAIAGVSFCMQLISFVKELTEGPERPDPLNTTLWVFAMATGFCSFVMSSMSLVSGIFDFAEVVSDIGETASATMESVGKFFSKASAAIAILLIAIDITQFFVKALHGEFKGSELLFQTITLIANVAVASVGLALAAASISTVYGAVFGIVIAALSFLGMWLSAELNNPSIDVQRCTTVLPAATKLNMRRHGSLEEGDTINYELKVRNDSPHSHGWIRARYILQEMQDSNHGWTTGGSWHSYGNWVAPWYSPPFGIGSNFWTTFSQTIPGPTTNLHYRFDLEYDWQRFELIIIVPTWWRTTGTRHTSTQEMEMSVLDNNIADFYDDTSELMSTTLLKQEFERAVIEYQWKDASDIAEEIISRTESKAKTPSDEFVHLNESKEEYNDDYYLYHTTTGEEFYSLIETHYESGIIAKVPVPADIWHPNRALGPKMRNMLSYNYSDGYVLITHDWFYNKTQELGDSVLYSQLLQELPLRTNIRTDLRENPLDIDQDTKKCHANFQLYLEGPDNPDVDFVITPPEGFSITQTNFTQRLQETISITIIQEDPYKIMGLYYFELKMTLNDVIIYSTFVPIRVNDFSLIDYVAYIPTEPINPGDSFKLLDVVNLGTINDSVVLTIEGLPGDFISKDLYPDEFSHVTYLDGSLVVTYLNGSVVMIPINETNKIPYVVTYLDKPYEYVQFFSMIPGDSRESLRINPPRKFTSAPGLYEFNITAINPRDGSTYFIYQGSFIVAEFYDLDFQCYNPAFSILDNETCTYYFNITNLGNTEEVFTVTYTDIGIASSYLDEDTFVLAPGQTGYFEILLDPLKIGHQEFVITVASEHITKYNLASITIADDDVDPPVLSDLVIQDDIHHIFATLKACDYSGISEFKIYIDGILIEPQIMTQIGDYYSFVLNNEWILLYGIHEIDIYVTDADDDRAFDNLTSSISGLFEISLDQMYEYVDWQIEVLKEFVEENTYCSVSRYLNKKLLQAQSYLHKALEYCESGEITCGLWKVYVAKLYLKIAEHKTEIYNKIRWIDDYIADYIIETLHIIRNNIVILMGVSTDPEIGYEIALIKIELLNLHDFVEQNISRYYRSSLNNYIKGAAKNLETALFKISMDINPNCSFTCAQWKLDKAICKVNWLLDKGKISQELADILFAKINQINLAIEELKYLI